MRSPEGKNIVHFGTYREIRSPEKLVFSWILDNQGCDASEGMVGETLVTVDLRDFGGSTELILTHELFPTAKARDGHEWGGTGASTIWLRSSKEGKPMTRTIAETTKSIPKPIQDYTLLDNDGKSVKLSGLFGGKDPLVVLHNMGKGCPSHSM